MKHLRMSKRSWLRLAIAVCIAGGIGADGASWAPKTPRLATPWTEQVSVENPLPEYPRPKSKPLIKHDLCE